MSLPHQSIATISAPQFINLQPLDINPLMSSCDIKVLYLGKNRNGSYISKDVAEEMAKTLRGAPIVGYYKKDKQDFRDHGEVITWDGDEVRFDVMTKPYGFVAPNAQVWFKDFQDFDEFGNSKVRTYLMTTGYLWTGQYEQAKQALESGKPQSMELDDKSLEGHWSTDINDDIDFFIINDAIFSKLCILGDDVEPCFQGAAITAPDVSTSFTLDDSFKQTLFSMMNELTNVLKGGHTVTNTENVVTEETTAEVSTPDTFTEENAPVEETSVEQTEESASQEEPVEEQFEQAQEAEPEEEPEAQSTEEPETAAADEYAALEEKYNLLNTNFEALQQQVQTLRAFKKNIENQQKDELIAEFYMLSDEDKQDVIDNKDKYTLDEIKSKLAVICFEKRVNFNLENSSENENSVKEQSVVTFNVDKNDEDSSIPDWVKEVESTMNKID